MSDTLSETTARLTFQLAPTDHVEFERCFQGKLVPILEKVGLPVSKLVGRDTVGNVFSKLLTVDTPADVQRYRQLPIRTKDGRKC